MNIMEENYELAKWLAGEMTEIELDTFKQSADYLTYTKIKEYSSQLEAPTFDKNQLYQKVIKSKKPTFKVFALHQSQWLKVAAIFVVLLGLTFILKPQFTSVEYAGNAQKKHFLLPDHSEVVLNSGSEINYSKWNWDNHRHLNLKGEAYFKVAKGKKFETETSLGTVTVLGTQFNVKARKNRFEVTCYEGRVKVNYQKQEVIITKGKNVAFLDGKRIAIPKITSTKPEWTNNELVFNKENLEAIIEELHRQYDIDFESKNLSSKQLFTGTIPMNNLDVALQILTTTYHLKHTKINTTKIHLEPVNAEK